MNKYDHKLSEKNVQNPIHRPIHQNQNKTKDFHLEKEKTKEKTKLHNSLDPHHCRDGFPNIFLCIYMITLQNLTQEKNLVNFFKKIQINKHIEKSNKFIIKTNKKHPEKIKIEVAKARKKSLWPGHRDVRKCFEITKSNQTSRKNLIQIQHELHQFIHGFV